MSEQKKLVVGMVGVANFGKYRRARMRDAGVFQIVAVCDRNPQALEDVAKEESATPYTDFDKMLEHPGLEAVVISTGADSHTRFSVAAMRKGLHVFVEKPLCVSMAEIAELRKVQKETGRVVGVGHGDCSKTPQLLLAKKYIDEGKLGVITAVEANATHSGGLRIQPGDWRGVKEKNPGGMLFQCGVHSLHSLRFLFGDVTEVMSMMRYDANPNTQTADASNVLLRYASGLLGTLNCYHTTAYYDELRIFGTVGNLYLDERARRTWFQPCYHNLPEPREELQLPEEPPHAAEGNLLSWFDGIRKGTPVYPSLEDGIAAVSAVFASVESAETGKVVRL